MAAKASRWKSSGGNGRRVTKSLSSSVVVTGHGKTRQRPEQLPDADGDEVEEDEGDGQGQHGERVRARGEDGRHHRDEDHRPAPGAQEAGRGDHAGQLQGDQDDRELEGEPEQGHHEPASAQVRNGVVDLLQVGPADRPQEAEGVGEGEVGGGRAGQEEHEGGGDEGDGVLLLPGLQAGGDEAPELEEDDRRGKDQAAEDGDLDPQREPVERRGDVEVGAVLAAGVERGAARRCTSCSSCRCRWPRTAAG